MSAGQPKPGPVTEIAGKWILPVILGIPLGALIMCGVVSGAGIWIVGGIGFIIVAAVTKQPPKPAPRRRPGNPPHRKAPNGQRQGSRQRY